MKRRAIGRHLVSGVGVGPVVQQHPHGLEVPAPRRLDAPRPAALPRIPCPTRPPWLSPATPLRREGRGGALWHGCGKECWDRMVCKKGLGSGVIERGRRKQPST